jgi:acyl-CoA synthetase (AMP-forming)/AMP-acid ligase II
MRLHDPLDYLGRERATQEFAVQGTRRLTYGEAVGAANRLANALIAAGVAPGARVGVLAKNCLEYPLFFYGCAKAGAVPVPLNYRLAAPEWEYILGDAGASVVIARGELVDALEPVRSKLPSVRRWLALDSSAPAGWEDYARWVAAAPDTTPGRSIDDDADCYQMYTSGTTGRPKGAVLSHAAVCEQLFQLTFTLSGPPGERVLIVAPMYHAAAAITALHAIVAAGTLVIHEDFDPAAVVRALSDEGIGRTTLVPAMIQACLVMVPDVARRRYPALRRITYGASPIAEAVLRRALEVFGCEFGQGYGMTETTAVLTALMPDDHRRALAGESKLLLSAGRAITGTEVRIVDGDDRPLPAGQVGEICGRGPQLMRGYWNMPEASAEALRGGWMHTGDAGYLDEDGFLYIQDRVKDMIVSGGENIYPREVEEVLFTHPAVADAAVIGVPDDRFGEAVKAIVVLKQGERVTGDDIINFCKGRLGGYKRPRSVDFVDVLPRNPSGKVLKKDLRAPYWKGHTRQVG